MGKSVLAGTVVAHYEASQIPLVSELAMPLIIIGGGRSSQKPFGVRLKGSGVALAQRVALLGY